MPAYEIKLASGRVVEIGDPDPENACRRAADLYGDAAVAWREPRVQIRVLGRGDKIIDGTR